MLKIMDNRELAIGQIKSLRLVHFYHIIRDNESVPAAMVYYDRDKVINLCVLDEHYDELIGKIWKVYADEKDNNMIVADEYTKTILDRALRPEDINFEQITEGYKKIDEPLCYHKGYMRLIVIPIVRYVVEQLYGMIEQRLLWNPMMKDWYGNGELKAMIEDSRQVFPYRITCPAEAFYLVEIGNVIDIGNKLKLGIAFTKSGVEISLESSKNVAEGYMNYILKDGNLYCSSDIKFTGKQVFNCNDLLSNSDVGFEGAGKAVLSYMYSYIDDCKLWKLPWGQLIVLTSESKSEGDITEVNGTISYIVTTEEEDSLFSISYRDIEIVNQVNYTIFNYAMDLYENKGVDGYAQCHFCDMGYGSKGYYKTNLVGNYYSAIREITE